ncbi:hypothetical protein [Escherichia coli]|uniref:Uncharacterized protein n=1 Tax=Escherichia phage PBECO4 TaxID=1273738 RepID=L7THD4_9CAUD|nr:hypothetical protein ACQ29_gp017 [Escherichia phage PBECO4]MCV8616334.1 hypothetical protein [Escherichia coli]MED6536447.1 hypothetical protein [Escherichia coli O157]WPK18848.1 hypothetical protein [Salmonella phage SD-6_S16]WPK19512.1 hypothetical protein [Salmonella phage SD-1_S14]WPK20543.1 hypothetical protein [Salmonella phage SD-15_S21]
MKSKPQIDEALGLPSAQQWIEMTGQEPEEDTEMNLYQDEDKTETEISLEDAKIAMEKLKAMRVQLRELPDITARKTQLDRLAQMAERKFEDIFDRAFNCEDRFAAEMINAANSMLKIALDAHAKIIDSDVKLVDLQLKKDKMEIELNLKPKKELESVGDPDAIEGQTVVHKTRNEMLASMNRNK